MNDMPLIVGAGPVGLAAALFLANRGVRARIIDQAREPSHWSKALAVNPRTLEILDSSGVTAKLLAMGKRIDGAQLWRNGRVAASITFEGLEQKHPFMLALSQAATERMLEAALAEVGVGVERGVKMVDCRTTESGVEAVLEGTGAGVGLTGRGPDQRTITVPWMLAADGAHSAARERLGVEFLGSTFPAQWHLADAPLHTGLAEDRAHVILLQDGEFLFLLCVIDPGLSATADPLWRILGNRPAPLSRIPEFVGRATGAPVWESSFRIAHRVNARMAEGRVYFAGDAAHVHSPIGARGMNLGIEDAWVLAHLAAEGRLDRYDALRQPVDHSVVKRIELLSRIVTSGGGVLSLVRRFLPNLAGTSAFRAQMVAALTGTDHPLRVE